MALSAERHQIEDLSLLSQPLVALMVHLKVLLCPADSALEPIDPKTLPPDAPPATGLDIGIIVNEFSRVLTPFLS